MADFDFDVNDDNNPRRRRRRDYTDDAWGMAEYEDYADGNAGDAEDYAGGLMPEEHVRSNFNEQDYRRPNADNPDEQYTVATNAPENQWRSQHIGSNSSDSVDQAARLLQRMNQRNSYPTPSQPTDRPRPLAANTPSRPPTAESAASVYTVGVMILLLIVVISCMILGFYVAFG